MTLERIMNNRIFHYAFFITLLLTTSTTVSLFFYNPLSLSVSRAWMWTMIAYIIYAVIPIAYIIEQKNPLSEQHSLRVFRVFFFATVLPQVAFCVQWFLQKKNFLTALLIGIAIIVYTIANDIIKHKTEAPSKHLPASTPHTKLSRRKQYVVWAMVVALMIAGVVLRTYFAYTGEIDGDEGNYLYDALHISRGFVPGEDFEIRGATYVYALSFWLRIVDAHTLVPARLFFVALFMISALFLVGCVWLATRSHKAILIATALFCLNPFGAYLGTILKTEPMQEFLHLGILFFVLLLIKRKQWLAIIPIIIFGIADLYTRPSSLLFIGFLLLIITYVGIEKTSFKAIIHPRSLPIILYVSGIILFVLSIVGFESSDYLQRLFPSMYMYMQGNFLAFTRGLITTINDMFRIESRVLLIECGATLLLFIMSGLWLVHSHKRRRILFFLYIAFFTYSIIGLGLFNHLRNANALQWTSMFAVIGIMIGLCLAYIIANTKPAYQCYRNILWCIVSYSLIILIFYLLFNRYYVSYVYELRVWIIFGATYTLLHITNTALPRILNLIAITTSIVIGFLTFFPATQDHLLIEKYHFRRHDIPTITKISGIIASRTTKDEEIFSGNTLFVANANRLLAMDISHPEFDYHDYPTEAKEELLLNYLQQDNIRYAIIDYKTKFFYFKKNKKIKKYINKNFTPIYIDEKNDIRILMKNIYAD